MKMTKTGAPSPIRYGLILALSIVWLAGCDAVSKRTPQQSHQSKGAPTMIQAQTAAKAVIAIPPVDEAEPNRLETATFATG
ncbi:MAG: hypothetical protein AMJ54_16815 [Deltaproteobacteria bacterium SG8_13]|nr:MAG: hypothetical protein AMJ54_16815 [Deltaproteobacteria bacterium SG8_13]